MAERGRRFLASRTTRRPCAPGASPRFWTRSTGSSIGSRWSACWTSGWNASLTPWAIRPTRRSSC